jgi:hypothetical protein
MASGWAEAFKERDERNREALARILAAITEEAGEDDATARRILRERVEAHERAIVDEAVRLMADKKQSRTADWQGQPQHSERGNGTRRDI